MNIVPVMKCRHMDASLRFYTTVLDFEHVGTWPDHGDPSFSILTREGAELYLSSHRGDGAFGNAVSVIVDEVDDLFRNFSKRGLNTSAKKDSPVHQGPLTQTWGTREFYVDDPDGNTVRFVKRD